VFLPLPSPEMATHSQQLATTIIQGIHAAGGSIPFNEFMQHALYTPALGYYCAGLRKFGAMGDFVTAPEISPLFSQCLAKQCQQILTELPDSTLFELGAGSGILAAELLKELQRLNCLPTRYWILEISADLQRQQYETLQKCVPDLMPRIHWLERLPENPLSGVIIANEVLDAMPIHRFCLETDQVSEFYVGYEGQQFIWQKLPTRNEQLYLAVTALRQNLPSGYISEINLALSAWIQALADRLANGLLLLIDYGFTHHEYYHPQRHQGTLMCHYRHYAHSDPLILVGLQDITAHVDFTAVMEAGATAGLQMAGYTNQANFLLACGLPELLATYQDRDMKTYLQMAQQVKTLILPSEMGELFKVVAFTRQWDKPLLGFATS